MADTIRADRSADQGGKAAARARAEAAFKGKPKTEGTEEKAPRVLENMASADDMNRWMTLVESAERSYEATQAALRQQKQAAKAVYDKVYSDAADAMKSRGVTKQVFRELYELKRQDEAKRMAALQSKLWAMKVLNFIEGQQLALFPEDGAAAANGESDGFDGQDELLRRAYNMGRDADVEGKHDNENPYHPSSPPGQRWQAGKNDSQADRIKAMGNKAN